MSNALIMTEYIVIVRKVWRVFHHRSDRVVSHYVVDAGVILHVSPLRTGLFLNCCGCRVFAGGRMPVSRSVFNRQIRRQTLFFNRAVCLCRPSVEVIWENFAKCFTKNTAYGKIVRRLNIFRITVWRNTQEAEGAPLLRV